jgi:hypothetical protein
MLNDFMPTTFDDHLFPVQVVITLFFVISASFASTSPSVTFYNLRHGGF